MKYRWNVFYRYSSTVLKPQPSQSFISFHTGIAITPSIQESLALKPMLMTSSQTSIIVPVTSVQASMTSKFLPCNTLSNDEEKRKKLKNGKSSG